MSADTLPTKTTESTSESKSDVARGYSAWPSRFAKAMAFVTFPLIWVGGLVTTYDAGMAVPDWPSTYGYNLFLYPIDTWLFGPWDLMIEHGHRLLGSLAGLMTIFFLVAIWRSDPRRWMFVLAGTALALVIFQGLLGGIRVLAVDREVAKIHGCVGPGFFAYCAVLMVLTSRHGYARTQRRRTHEMVTKSDAQLRWLCGLGFVTTLLAYTQLFLGANLRHIAVDAAPSTYGTLVLLHVAMAIAVVFHVIWLWILTLRFRTPGDKGEKRNSRTFRNNISRLAAVLLALAMCQFTLGLGTWVVKFGWPSFMADASIVAGYNPVAKSMLQANIVTAHVALGSLILAVSAAFTIRTFVQLPRRVPQERFQHAATGVTS